MQVPDEPNLNVPYLSYNLLLINKKLMANG